MLLLLLLKLLLLLRYPTLLVLLLAELLLALLLQKGALVLGRSRRPVGHAQVVRVQPGPAHGAGDRRRPASGLAREWGGQRSAAGQRRRGRRGELGHRRVPCASGPRAGRGRRLVVLAADDVVVERRRGRLRLVVDADAGVLAGDNALHAVEVAKDLRHLLRIFGLGNLNGHGNVNNFSGIEE